MDCPCTSSITLFSCSDTVADNDSTNSFGNKLFQWSLQKREQKNCFHGNVMLQKFLTTAVDNFIEHSSQDLFFFFLFYLTFPKTLFSLVRLKHYDAYTA